MLASAVLSLSADSRKSVNPLDREHGPHLGRNTNWRGTADEGFSVLQHSVKRRATTTARWLWVHKRLEGVCFKRTPESVMDS